MDHLVQGGGQGRFLRGDRGPPPVGRLEKPGVDHHFVPLRPAGRTQRHPQLLPAGEGAGHPGHRPRHPLVAGHHRLDGPFLRGQDFPQQGAGGRGSESVLGHSSSVCHTRPTKFPRSERGAGRRFRPPTAKPRRWPPPPKPSKCGTGSVSGRGGCAARGRRSPGPPPIRPNGPARPRCR